MNKYYLSLEPSLVWSISTLAYTFKKNERVADFILQLYVHARIRARKCYLRHTTLMMWTDERGSHNRHHHHNACIYIKMSSLSLSLCLLYYCSTTFTFTSWWLFIINLHMVQSEKEYYVLLSLSPSFVCVCTRESENKRKWNPRTAAVTWSRNFTSSFLFFSSSTSYSLTYILRNSASCSNIQDQFSFIRLRNNGWAKTMTTTTCLFT